MKNNLQLSSSRIGCELTALREWSARLGNNPELVQASNGNTSIKIDGTLWIKASGKCLTEAAREDLFMPIDLAEVRAALQQNADVAHLHAPIEGLRPSVETVMHSVLPHRVVIHVHSINAIVWAIRIDGPSQIRRRLADLRWQWVPYAPSGIPLAREIEKIVAFAPQTDVFILGNHGLVVCGEDCKQTEALLNEVEGRLAVSPRHFEAANTTSMASTQILGWQVDDVSPLRALARNPKALEILKGGLLYPCQAIFLGRTIAIFASESTAAESAQQWNTNSFAIVENVGVLLNKNITAAQLATLIALAQVIQRTEESAPIRYLTEAEVTEVLNSNAHGYNRTVARTQTTRSSRGAVRPSICRVTPLQLRP